jgi:hypothetical protein
MLKREAEWTSGLGTAYGHTGSLRLDGRDESCTEGLPTPGVYSVKLRGMGHIMSILACIN